MLRPTPLHPRLEAMQYLDFTNPKIRPWDRLIEEIKAAANVPLAHTINIPLNAPPYVRQAVMALDSANESDRIAAVYTLQRVRSPEVQTVLIEALRHPIGDVREASARALGLMRVTSAIPELIKLVHDPEREVRLAAAYVLGKIGDTTAIPVLAERLQAPGIDNIECKVVAIAMCKLGDEKAVRWLAEILCDEYARAKYSVTDQEWVEIGRIVGDLGDTTLTLTLTKVLDMLSLDNDYPQERAMQHAINSIQLRIDKEKQQGVSNP